MTAPDDGGAAFEAARPKLMAIAYRMLGSVAEAEDVIGDVAERWAVADREAVRVPEAWLVTTTTRRALDVLRSARLQRESYPGVWLPEPVATGDGPDDRIERSETLTMGFLLLLERLTPLERAVFVLHDVLDYPYREIADAVGRAEPACRQALHRARPPRHRPDPPNARRPGSRRARRPALPRRRARRRRRGLRRRPGAGHRADERWRRTRPRRDASGGRCAPGDPVPRQPRHPIHRRHVRRRPRAQRRSRLRDPRRRLVGGARRRGQRRAGHGDPCRRQPPEARAPPRHPPRDRRREPACGRHPPASATDAAIPSSRDRNFAVSPHRYLLTRRLERRRVSPRTTDWSVHLGGIRSGGFIPEAGTIPAQFASSGGDDRQQGGAVRSGQHLTGTGIEGDDLVDDARPGQHVDAPLEERGDRERRPQQVGVPARGPTERLAEPPPGIVGLVRDAGDLGVDLRQPVAVERRACRGTAARPPRPSPRPTPRRKPASSAAPRAARRAGTRRGAARSTRRDPPTGSCRPTSRPARRHR